MSLRQYLLATAADTLPAPMFETRQARRALDDFGRVGLAFIHVPRTAGLSVNRAIYQLDTVRHFTVEQFLRVADPDTRRLPRFTIVRNPWDRAVSAYQFARNGGVPGGSPIARPQRYQGPEFTTFESFVTGYLSRRDLRKTDGVFRPQTYYVRDRNGDNPFDHVGLFDRLHQTEHWLSERLGGPVRITGSNATKHRCYRQYYNSETRAIVERLYLDDIETFAFEF